MHTGKAIFLGPFTGILILSAAPALAEYIWHQYGRHRYALTAPGTWEEAEAESVAIGGHLVTINNEAENNWLYQTFGITESFKDLWIGFNDVAQEGHWVWVGEVQDPGQYWDGGWWESGNPSSTSLQTG